MMNNVCKSCQKIQELCICEQITALSTHLKVVILQHPQEPDKTLGSARIANLALENSVLKVGLSWPNLSKIVGRQVNNANWGVLYLGGRGDPKQKAKSNSHLPTPRVQISTKNGEHFDVEDAALEGIVVLDGTWSQAKTLWWRNAWLLKLKRIVLNPQRRSLYGNLRREPRRECLSTIESLAEALESLGESAEVAEALRGHFKTLLGRYQKVLDAENATKPARAQDPTE